MWYNSSQGSIPVPTPDVRRVLSPIVHSPVVNQEQMAHFELVIRRADSLNAAMMGWTGVVVSPDMHTMQERGSGIAEIGKYTYFSLRREHVLSPDGINWTIGLILAGHKSCLVDGRIVIGGSSQEGNVCAYDFRFKPFLGAQRTGRIIDARKTTTIRTGLNLDSAIEDVVKDRCGPTPCLLLPEFWAAFPDTALPTIEDTPAARRLGLESVQADYRGAVLPCLRSPGGKISHIDRDSDIGTAILFNANTSDERCITLPITAVLRAYVREGHEVKVGAELGDFLPRRMYPSWSKLVDIYGLNVTDWLMTEAVLNTDASIEGLYSRRVDLCPGQLSSAVKVYEDIRHLLDADGYGIVHVLRTKTKAPLNFARGAVTVDFAHIRPEWYYKFDPIRRQKLDGEEETNQVGSTQ